VHVVVDLSGASCSQANRSEEVPAIEAAVILEHFNNGDMNAIIAMGDISGMTLMYVLAQATRKTKKQAEKMINSERASLAAEVRESMQNRGRERSDVFLMVYRLNGRPSGKHLFFRHLKDQ